MAETPNEWIPLRSLTGRYLGRYHPPSQRLILVERSIETPYELAQYHVKVQGKAGDLHEKEIVLG